MKNLRYLVSAGLLSAVALSFMGCQARPLLGPADGVDAQGRFDSRGKEADSRMGGKPQAVGIDFKKELVITDLSVVEDPYRTTGNGPWTFGYLISQMAGGQDPDTFVKNWLNTWMADQSVNGDPVLARKKIKDLILDPWPRIPGTDRLDLNQAPFRLLAVTNRLDIRGVGNIGEGRFVFGVLDTSPTPPFGEALPFTLIFEYGITLEMGDPEYEGDDHDRGYDKEGADDRMKAVKAWAAKWHALSKLPYGPQYNAALQQITDAFSKAGANHRKPNGSALNQLRTNEIALSLAEAFGPTGPTVPIDQIKPWEMREFHVTSAGLKPVPVALTPQRALNGSAQLANYINKNEKKILRDRHEIPTNMLAGSSLVPGAFNSDAAPVPSDLPIIWNAPGIRNPEARFKFAQNTCSGCHLSESGFEKDATNGAFIPGKAFLHVRPRLAGVEAQLSPFMLGVTTKDAVTGHPRTLNDIERRVDDMQVLLGYSRTSKFYDPRTEMENPFPSKAH